MSNICVVTFYGFFVAVFEMVGVLTTLQYASDFVIMVKQLRD